VTVDLSIGLMSVVPVGLRIVRGEQNSTLTVRLEGECDLAGRDQVRDAVAAALARRPGNVVLDLSRLSFIDSSGVHVVVEAAKHAASQSTSLSIVPGPPAVQRVFEICRLTEILPFSTNG
jgi:anti-sigma B factor antagonist